MDALGELQSVLVLGGTSDIALATVALLPRGRLRRVILAGRKSAALDEAVANLTAAGVSGVESVQFDATDTSSHEAFINDVFDGGDIDVVLLAFGVLGDQAEAEADPEKAVATATTNYTGAVSVGLNVGRRLRKQGHGTLVVLSSVAGDRARRSNYVYGSTKAGLDTFAQGLGDALHGTGAKVLVVRPGFVRSRMTVGMKEAPLSVNTSDVGEAIVSALKRGKETVYVPSTLRVVMTGLKSLPRPVFRKLPS